ncbi:MAG TPA: hypothetical protein VJT74_17655 [Pyrinomonadaceae bacterium]|nr:hypothetical protein [Pyrinomonadaceae bacterium]
MEKINYLGLDCQKLSNGAVELVVTTNVGPRILRYAFAGEENILGEAPDAVAETELGVWRAWGGHRLWTAPEAKPRSYAPDNDPVEFEAAGENAIRLVQRADASGVEKEMLVALDAEGTNVTVRHRITNRNLWAIEAAPWALTIMNGGGVAIFPQEPFRAWADYLLPARPLVLWHYTDLTDPRWTLGQKYIRLRSDASDPEPQKIGMLNKRGWAAYLRGETLFVKRAAHVEGATYPDYNCNFETYTAGAFIEVETLGPSARLEPNEAAEHTETWSLHSGVTDENLDATLDALEGF